MGTAEKNQEEINEVFDSQGEETQTEETQTEETQTEETQTEEPSEVEELKKQIAGLKHGISSERGKRQEMQGRLAQIDDIFKSAQEEPGKKDSKIPVEFDDDGNPFISQETLETLTSQQTKEINEKIALLENEYQQNRHVKAIEDKFKSVIEPENKEIYSELESAKGYADKIFSEYITTNGLNPPKSLEEAMEIIEDQNLDAEFQKKYPNLDIENTILSFTSPRRLKKTIRQMASLQEKSDDKMSGVKALSDKPGSHAGRSSSPGKADLTLDRIADLSSEDFLNLSDSEIQKINRILKDSE